MKKRKETRFVIETTADGRWRMTLPVALVGNGFGVVQSGCRDRICYFRTAEAAEEIRQSFADPESFAVREVGVTLRKESEVAA